MYREKHIWLSMKDTTGGEPLHQLRLMEVLIVKTRMTSRNVSRTLGHLLL